MSKTVLVPIDVDQETSWQLALPAAARLADPDTKIVLLAVLPDIKMTVVFQYIPADFEALLKASTKEKLQDLSKEYLPDNSNVSQAVRHGGIYREILCMADEIEANLIVMASHRPELADFLIGANAARVVRHAKCSVYVVRGES